MTCGCCHSAAMASGFGIDPKRNRVFGYAAGQTTAALAYDVRWLYFFGASFVFWDSEPTTGQNVASRSQLKTLRRVLRAGDVLLIRRLSAFGTNPAYSAKFAKRLQEGSQVKVLVFDGHSPEDSKDAPL